MLVKVTAVARAAVVARQVEFFAAQAKVVLLVQGLAKFGQKAGEGVGVEGWGLEIEPANAVSANGRVVLPACVFPDGGIVKLAGFPECLAGPPQGQTPVVRDDRVRHGPAVNFKAGKKNVGKCDQNVRLKLGF